MAARRCRPVARRAGIVVSTAMLTLATAAAGHDLWLEASAPARVGEPVPVRLMIGHGDQVETLPRRDGRIVRFEAIGPGGTVLPVLGVDGGEPAGYFKPTAPGTWTVVYASTPLNSELPAERFAAYLREEGLDEVLAEREARGETGAPGRERYRRSLKLRLPVRAANDDSEPGEPGEDAPRSLPFELVDEGVDPAGRVGLRVLREGVPHAGVLVELRPLAGSAQTHVLRSDGQGRVAVTLTAGTWMAAAVRMDRAARGGWASWRSVFTTLVFEVGAPLDGVETQ